MKKKWMAVLLGICIALPAAGCSSPAEEQAQPKEQEETSDRAEETQETAEIEAQDYYGDLIAAARECVRKNDGEQPEGYDFSSILYVKKDWDYGILGYRIEDLDGNGTEELIFGGNTGESGQWYDGIVYDIYTVYEGELVHVLDGWERNRYFLCENGMIANEGESSAFESTRSYFTLEGAQLHLAESITIQSNKEENDTSEKIYFYSAESQYDTEHAKIISEEEAEAVMEKYHYLHPAFIPFAEEGESHVSMSELCGKSEV